MEKLSNLNVHWQRLKKISNQWTPLLWGGITFTSPPNHLIFVAMDAPNGEAQVLFGLHG